MRNLLIKAVTHDILSSLKGWNMGNFIDLKGKRFGILFVLSQHASVPKKPRGRRITWLCKCDCGNDRIVVGEYLVSGLIKSCGCINKRRGRKINDLSGKRFGKLLILRQGEHVICSGKKVITYLCKCDCGKEKIIRAGNFKKGQKSCGCILTDPKEKRQRTKISFESNLIKNESTGCLEWLGKLDPQGYGYSYINGKIERAHRVSWILYKGDIPKNMCICHKCDNRKCANIDHLFLGSRKENYDDMVKKGRRKNNSPLGEKHYRTKFKEEDINNIIKNYREGMKFSEIAKLYNCHRSTIYLIFKRKTWKHLHDI